MRLISFLIGALLLLPLVSAEVPPGITDLTTGIKMIWDGSILVGKGFSALTAGVIAKLTGKPMPIEVGNVMNIGIVIFAALVSWHFLTGMGKYVVIAFLLLLLVWLFLSI